MKYKFLSRACLIAAILISNNVNAQSSTVASGPTAIRIEQATPFRIEQGGGKSLWEVLLPGLVAALAGFGGTLVGGWIGLRSSAAAINQKNNEAELAVIRSKLDTFYGPFIRRSQEGMFLARELVSRQPDKATFRTIVKLLDPNWLQSAPRADQTIVDTLVENGVALRSLIRDSAGAVDPSISEYLARAATHFTMLDLAKRGALENDPERLALYVFPWQLDDVLKLEVSRLNARLNLLQGAPSTTHPPMLALQIPVEFKLSPWPESGRDLTKGVSTTTSNTLAL